MVTPELTFRNRTNRNRVIKLLIKCISSNSASFEIKPYNSKVVKANYKIIREMLSQVNWTSELPGGFTAAYIDFAEILESSMEGCIPEYKCASIMKNIYFTAEAIRKKNLKNNLWRRYTRNKSSYDKRRYCTFKKELRSLTRKLRLEYERSIAQNIKSSPKSFWSYVKSKTKTKCKIPPLGKTDGSEAMTSIDKAETLNKFFSNNFTDERVDDIPNDSGPFLGEYLNSFITTQQMVQIKIQEMKPGKSPGSVGWHPVFLKNVADLISQPLSILFQKSLIEGIVPSQWLKACITAIHKKGAKNIFENWWNSQYNIHRLQIDGNQLSETKSLAIWKATT